MSRARSRELFAAMVQEDDAVKRAGLREQYLASVKRETREGMRRMTRARARVRRKQWLDLAPRWIAPVAVVSFVLDGIFWTTTPVTTVLAFVDAAIFTAISVAEWAR